MITEVVKLSQFSLTVEPIHGSRYVDEKPESFRLFLGSPRLRFVLASLLIDGLLPGDAFDQLGVIQFACQGKKGSIFT